LQGEAISVIALDTFVAILAGLIIFPAAFSFGIDANSGPGLIFVTLPNIFTSMTGGQLWQTLFFLFMCFAAMTTVIAVFENLVACLCDKFKISRIKSVIINFVVVSLLSVPCALGFNVWSGFQPLGPGTGVLDLEDFIVSNNILPLGSMVFLFFCTTRWGWGWEKFIEEANTGKGRKFPSGKGFKFYLNVILPIIMLVVFVMGYVQMFGK
jgi:NSS family neurotransmitter:Na+ symporter